MVLRVNLGATNGWVLNATPRPFYRRETDPVPVVQEAEWAPGPVCSGEINLVPLPGVRSRERPARSESLYSLRHPGPLSSGFHTETLKKDVVLSTIKSM